MAFGFSDAFSIPGMAGKDEISTVLVKDISLEMIDDDPQNKEIFTIKDIEELAHSIENIGLITPIVVSKKADGRYQIVSGHRRALAMRQLGKKTISAVIKGDLDEVTRVRQLVESNLHTRDLTPMQRARSLKVLYEVEKISSSQNDENAFDNICEKHNISKGTLSKMLRLVDLIPELQELVDNYAVTWTSMYPVATLEPEKQQEVFEVLSSQMGNKPEEDRRFTAAEIQAAIQSLSKKKPEKKPKDEKKLTKIQSSFVKINKETSYLIKVSDDKLKNSPEDLQAFEENVKSLRETLVKLEDKLSSIRC